MAKKDIVALGDCVVNFVMEDSDKAQTLHLTGSAGGSSAIALAAAAKLGRSTALISQIGRDAFGNFLLERLAEAGIDTQHIAQEDLPTILSMSSPAKNGDPVQYVYYQREKDLLADYILDKDLIAGCRVFHFGSILMSNASARAATLKTATYAKESGIPVSFDPNYKPFLWENEQEAINAMTQGIELADYVKLSRQEALMLTGESDPEKAALYLVTRYNILFAAVTLGPEGSVGLSSKARVRVPTYTLSPVDETGAGDAFWGAALHRLLAYRGSGAMDEKSMYALLQFSNAAGAIAASRSGAVSSLAGEEEIKQYIEANQLPPRENKN